MEAVRAGFEEIPLWLLGLGLFLLFAASAEAGRRLGLRAGSGAGEDAGYVVSASLGLLALLLGFTVSMAVARFEDRRIATTAEANAIGTFIYRADLLPPDLRRQTLAALDAYVDARLDVARIGAAADGVARAKAITAQASARLWQQFLASGAAVPDTAVRILVVESANQMFDAATLRDAALGNRLPATLVMLLIFFPVASLILIGYVSKGAKGVHVMASTEMILLLTLVLLLIADLDRPRSGTIFNSQAVIMDVRAQLDAALARPLPR
jgi:hypothetical protein